MQNTLREGGKGAYIPFRNFGKGKCFIPSWRELVLVHSGVTGAAVSEEYCAREERHHGLGVGRRARFQRVGGSRREIEGRRGNPNERWKRSSVLGIYIEYNEEEEEEP